MANRDSKRKAPENSCRVCRHLESEHSATGTKPCLATVGNLPFRDFCPCDAFQPKVAKVA